MVLLMVLCTMLPFLLFSLFLTLVNCCLFRMHTMAFYFSSFPYVFLGHASLSPLPRYTFCQTNNQLKNFNILNMRNKIVSFQSIVMLTLLIFLTHFGVIYLETQLYRKKPMRTRLWFLCRKQQDAFSIVVIMKLGYISILLLVFVMIWYICHQWCLKLELKMFIFAASV